MASGSSAQPAVEEDNEVGLSRSALNKLIKDTIPQVRVANETRELLHNCCVEFIKHVGAEANRLCNEEAKKTIGQEHIFRAFINLGFGQEYVDVAQSVLDECKEQAARKLKRQNSRLEKCGIPEEELLRQQQELIEKAKAEQAASEQMQLAQLQGMLASQAQNGQGQNLGLGNQEFHTSLSRGRNNDLDEDYDAD